MDDTSLQSPLTDSNANSPPRFVPYTTAKHRVTKGRYITSTDPRGYVPVYEYPLNNQWIMMDVDDGYILWTGIWKALGNSKADIVKMIESQPDLASQLRRVRGGYLKIQGTWLPYEVALRLARRVAWTIREDLIPLFGPTFPSTCLSPEQPGYGQIAASTGRRKSRRSVGGQPLLAPAPNESSSSSSLQDSQAHLARPSSRTGPHSPAPMQQGPSYDFATSYNPSSYYHSAGPAPGPSSSAYPSPIHHPRTAEERYASSQNPQLLSTRHRYNPYPPSGPSPSAEFTPSASPPSRHSFDYRRPSDQSSARHALSERDPRYNLPPISSIGLEHSLPNPGYSLPPIGALREGDRPDMDASAVLRRLRLDDSAADGSTMSRPSSAPPPPGPYHPYDHRAQPASRPDEPGPGPSYPHQYPGGPSIRPSYQHHQDSAHSYSQLSHHDRHSNTSAEVPSRSLATSAGGWDAPGRGSSATYGSISAPAGDSRRDYYGDVSRERMGPASSQSSRGPNRPW